MRKSPEPLSPGSVQPVLGDLDIWKSLRLDSCENNDRHLNRKYRRKVDKVTMFTKRIDTIYNELLIPKEKYDFLNIDLQGCEIFALRSMGDLLWNFKYAYLEINTADVYKGCAQVGEIDAYMAKFGFRGYDTKMVGNWGDKFYKRG